MSKKLQLKERLCMTLMSIIIFLMSFTIIGNNTVEAGLLDDKDLYVEGAQEVIIQVEYDHNFIFAKDPLDIYIDNHKFYSVENGDTHKNTYNLTKGMHVIKLSSGKYHYAALEFEVKNTGDFFNFKVINHTSSVELLFESSGNYYTALGQEVPETVDDSSVGLTSEQIEEAKTHKNIIFTPFKWIWNVFKTIFIFVTLILCMAFVGYIISAIMNAINLNIVGLIAELIFITCMVSYKGITVFSIIAIVGFLIIWRIVSSKLKKVPKIYRNYSSINDSKTFAYATIYSLAIAIMVVAMPEWVEKLPFTIKHINIYMYVYMAFVVFYSFICLSDDLEYPEKIRQYVNEKGIVSEKDIEEYILKDIDEEYDDEEDVEYKKKKMVNTLVELSKSGLIEMDAKGKVFKRKE